MTMAMGGNSAAGGPLFSVGGVITASLSVVFINALRFLAIILIVAVPVAVLLILGTMVMMAGSMPTGGAGLSVAMEGGSAPQILFVIFAAFLGLLAYFLIQSALTYGALQYLRDRPASIGACLSNGLNALPRVLVASIVLFVVMGFSAFIAAFVIGGLLSSAGNVLGVVVGLLLAAVFLFAVVLLWVFVPAIVVERAGPLECFTRSVALTKGHRWGIFGILLLVGVANWIISFISEKLGQVAPVVGGIIDIASSLFFMALGSVLAAVGYYYLRAEKEGVVIDDIVKVFD
jgi:hypothetical protein